MNKIPFTSQNPYAFYAKTIDRYDTEKYKESNKTKSIKKEDLVFSSSLLMGKTCLGDIQYS
jgi:hypothetical protein